MRVHGENNSEMEEHLNSYITVQLLPVYWYSQTTVAASSFKFMSNYIYPCSMKKHSCWRDLISRLQSGVRNEAVPDKSLCYGCYVSLSLVFNPEGTRAARLTIYPLVFSVLAV